MGKRMAAATAERSIVEIWVVSKDGKKVGSTVDGTDEKTDAQPAASTVW